MEQGILCLIMPHPSFTNLLFMGLGAALCYGASQLRRGLQAAGQARRVGVRGAAAPSAGPLTDLRPGDIIAAIKQAPVMQQERAGKAYRGAAVCWPVSFESAFSTGPFSLRVMCQDQGNYPWINFDVRRGKYPPLAGLLPHAPLVVQGRISHIKSDEIYLRQVSLRFPQ